MRIVEAASTDEFNEPPGGKMVETGKMWVRLLERDTASTGGGLLTEPATDTVEEMRGDGVEWSVEKRTDVTRTAAA